MGNTIVKNAFKIFFEKGPEEFNDFLIEKKWGKGLDESGFLIDHYKRAMCLDYRIKDPYSRVLMNCLKSGHAAPPGRERMLLNKAGLLNELGVLTIDGKYKAVSELNLSDQIGHCGIAYKEMSLENSGGKSVEQRVAAHIEDKYEAVVQGEGLFFNQLKLISIFNIREHLLSSITSHDFIRLIRSERYRDPVDLLMEINGILRNKRFTYLEMSESEFFLDIQLLIREINIAISKCIGSAKEGTLINNARCLVTHGGLPGLYFDEEVIFLVSKLLNSIGIKNFRSLMSKVYKNSEFVNFTGWPDLTAISRDDIYLLEIKQKRDKLHFSQLAMIDSIKRTLYPEIRGVEIIYAKG